MYTLRMLFEIWTRRNPYEDLEHYTDEEIAERKQRGLDPPLPKDTMSQALTDSYTAFRAIQEATRACFRPDPRQRPSANQIAQGLESIYQRLLLADAPLIPDLNVADSLRPFFGATDSIKSVT